jgi:hypothetical protein
MHAISMKLFNSMCRGAICKSGVFSHNCDPFAAMNPCTILIILNFVSSGSSAHVHKTNESLMMLHTEKIDGIFWLNDWWIDSTRLFKILINQSRSKLG